MVTSGLHTPAPHGVLTRLHRTVHQVWQSSCSGRWRWHARPSARLTICKWHGHLFTRRCVDARSNNVCQRLNLLLSCCPACVGHLRFMRKHLTGKFAALRGCLLHAHLSTLPPHTCPACLHSFKSDVWALGCVMFEVGCGCQSALHMRVSLVAGLLARVLYVYCIHAHCLPTCARRC